MSPAKPFIHPDFLLETPVARELYHNVCESLTIIDYHCHLPVEPIASNASFGDLYEIWLAGDHYKWRAMRSNGVPEEYITGGASNYDKYLRWAETVPHLLRNPLYHWTHLELNRPFGISDRLLAPDTAKDIWEDCGARLALSSFSCRGIMEQMGVVLVCTTDDPVDHLRYHIAVRQDESFGIQVLPTWRPDQGMRIDQPEVFNAWLDRLSTVTSTEIRDWDEFLGCLQQRHDFFAAQGCCLSDHGLDRFYAKPFLESQVREIFRKVRAGNLVGPDEVALFRSAFLYHQARMDHAAGWTQQYHVGAMRNNNSRFYATLGPDTGFDSIGDEPIAADLSRFLDRLDKEGCLTKTILYNLNPRDNAVIATMLGNFMDGDTPGKIQFGSAWWFLDQLDGMTRQIEDLSQMGLLARFVGMLTDSRSFLSYTRHEYFRRLLCNLIGSDIHRGLIPQDLDLVRELLVDICYRNAVRYFRFDLPDSPV